MISEKISWKKLSCNLSKDTLSALKKLKFTNPTPIQIHSIPTFLAKKDIVAQAVTGSGKTLSFIIPIMEFLKKANNLKKSDIFAIILSPTTELANQTLEMFNDFLSKYKGEKPLVKLFKDKVEDSVDSDNKGIVIISTPGLLAKGLNPDCQSSTVAKSLRSLEVLVMDEADRLLEMGFSAQLYTIIKALPKQRLTALFSATQTTEVDDLIRTGMRNPVRVCVKVTKGHSAGANDTLPMSLTNYHLTVDCEKKLDVLIQFLKDNISKKMLVFFATCSSVDYFNRILTHILKKHKILCMHRKLKAKRGAVFQDFKNLEKGVMLCTDVMARGIDIPNIDWVVQFDPPKCASNFVHRCGRTARCDQIGQTLLLLQPNENVYLNFLTANQNVQMDEYSPTFDMASLKSHHKIVQDACIKDRLVYEKSVRAFVSYIEYYKKHELKYIFKLPDLNMGRLGNGFGLLRLPQMRELNNVDQGDFRKAAIDLATLTYRDKSVRNIKEKTRGIKQERRRAEEEAALAEGYRSKKDLQKEKDLQKNKRAAKKNKRAKKAAQLPQAGERHTEHAGGCCGHETAAAAAASPPQPPTVETAVVAAQQKKRKSAPVGGSGLLSTLAKKSKL